MTEKPDQTESAEDVTTSPNPRQERRSWRPGSIIFGLLLILLGALFFLQNSGITQLDMSGVWRLWPLLIVALGISLMSLRRWLGTTLMLLLILGALGLVILVSTRKLNPGQVADVSTKTVEVSPQAQGDTGNDASVSIKDGAGTITIGSDNSTPLVKASLESNVMNLSQTSNDNNGKQSVELVVGNGGGSAWWGGNYKNDLNVTLGESLPIDLDVNAGASTISADLTKVQTRQLGIDSGASKINIKLGDKSDTANVSINAGMSTVTLTVPRTSGVSMHIDSPMSSLDLPGLHQVGKGVYESDNYTSSSKKINIQAHTGMGKFSIDYS